MILSSAGYSVCLWERILHYITLHFSLGLINWISILEININFKQKICIFLKVLLMNALHPSSPFYWFSVIKFVSPHGWHLSLPTNYTLTSESLQYSLVFLHFFPVLFMVLVHVGILFVLGDGLLCKYFCGLSLIFIVFFSKQGFRSCPNFKWYPGSFRFSGCKVRFWDGKFETSVTDILDVFFCRKTSLLNTCRTPVGLIFSRTPEDI